LLKLLLENRFPRIWVPSPENRDLRQLLWHRYRLVQIRTRIMNQLQALAMNEGRRWKHRLWSEEGRAQLEKFPLAPWASRPRQDLLELLVRHFREGNGNVGIIRRPLRAFALPDPSSAGTTTCRRSSRARVEGLT
jgi:transposase